MKKFLLLLVAMILATATRAAVGDTFTYQGLNFKVLSETDRTVAVALNENASGDITIPSYVVKESSRYIVTEIGEDAFQNCIGLSSVSIPNSVTTIQFGAFWGCSGLTSVTLPNSVTEIESYAFNDCSSLTSVSIPDSVTEIGSYAFDSCNSLTSVFIPNSVTKIWFRVFAKCSNLIEIIVVHLYG